jgi:type IV pilus assembly protein PilB
MSTYHASFTKPYGMILVTGPTGSGKSTTLYTTLHAVAKPEINVITVEDPVEYRIAGINQVQVNVKAGLTFASALRSILRSDPDVVLIGEIRDQETAQIAIEASLTGHLVLSTLHTNDAPSAFTRMIDMGVEPFLIASGIQAVVNQRLARRLCDSCKQPDTLDADSADLGEDAESYEPVGCVACGGTGYLGRIGLYEVLVLTDEIRSLILGKAASSEIQAAAVSAGMHRLREDGIEKVRQGITSMPEVLRVIGSHSG